MWSEFPSRRAHEFSFFLFIPAGLNKSYRHPKNIDANTHQWSKDVNAHLQNRTIEIYPDVTRKSEYLHLENMTADNYEELN